MLSGGENPPRLFITKMVLENFKSYGGEREVGPFHKRFSSIVGPNGSGKSNVIDAMLFVFGKKAKKLRLNKVQRSTTHLTFSIRGCIDLLARALLSVWHGQIIAHSFNGSFSAALYSCLPNDLGILSLISPLFVVSFRNRYDLIQVSELIHKSDGFPNLEYCRVSVHFVDIVDTAADDDEYTEVPGTGLVVTRVAYKNNTSKYLLDGVTATFAEVGALLRKRGIDLDNNRFLILQGEVEQIAMMPPKAKTEHDEGLLEFLEDIIGSNRHLEAINAAEKVLEAANDERGEKLARLKVTETERDNLEGAKKEAEASVRKARQVRVQQNILYQKHAADAQHHIATLESKHGEIMERKSYEAKKLAEKKAECAELEAKGAAHTKEYDAICKELKNTNDQFAAYERQDIKLREDIKHNKATLKKLAAEAKKCAEQQATSEAAAATAEASVSGLEATVAKCTTAKSELEAKLETLLEAANKESETLRSGLEAKQAAIAPVKQHVSEVEASIGTTETEIDLMKRSVTEAQAEMTKVNADLARLTEEQRTKAAEKDAAASESKKLTARLSALAEEEVPKLEAQESDLKSKMASAVSAAEEAKAAFSSSASSGKAGAPTGVVGALLAASAKGKPLAKAGLVGRLGDLGTVGSEYDVAVSTACGYLDYMVVENEAGGAACIEYLRKHDLGRVSFIVMSQIASKMAPAMARPFTAPPGSQRLYDLVKPMDPELQCAFYFALRDTLVAKDLDSATAMAYQGNKAVHRVVTLGGDLIETSGTLSGGGNRVKKGGILLANSKAAASAAAAAASSSDGEEVTAEQVAALEAAAEKCSQALSACRAKLTAARQELRDSEARLKTLAKSLPKLDMALAAGLASLPGLEARKVALLPQCTMSSEDNQKVAALEAHVAKARKDSAAAFKEHAKLQADIDALQAQIMAAGGEPVKVLRKQVEKSTKALDDAEAAVVKAGVDSKDARKAAEKHGKAAKKAEAEGAELEVKHAKVQEEFAELDKNAQEVLVAYKAAEASAKEKKKEHDAMTKEIEAMQKEIAKIKAVEVDIDEQVKDFTAKIKENEKKAQHWTAQVSDLNQAHAACLKDWGELPDEEGDNKEEDKQEAEAEAEEEEGGADEDNKESSGDAASAMAEEEGEELGDAEAAAAAAAESAEPEPANKRGKKSTRSAVAEEEAIVLQVFTPDQLNRYDTEQLKYAIALLEEERDELTKGVNMAAIAEYRAKAADHAVKFGELEACTQQRDEARATYDELRKQRLDDFMDGFGHITLKLKEMYQMITLGGDAELELVDSLDPFRFVRVHAAC
jgi:structural maintenance of chromosome 4